MDQNYTIRGRIKIKRGTGSYYTMPYINMSKNAQAVNMLQTVRINYECYTKKEVESNILARKVQARVSHPLDTGFKNMVRDKLLAIFSVKLEHIANANNIFSPNVTGLRSESVRTKPTWV